MTQSADLFRQLLALQGVTLPEDRAPLVAEVLEKQLHAELDATRALAFETEPASFARTLHEGGR